MTTAPAPATVPTSTGQRSRLAMVLTKVRSGSAGFGVRITLILVALFWLLPGLGLLVTSVRPLDDVGRTGWWETLTNPSRLTFENYSNLLGSDSEILHSLVVSIYVSVPTTLITVGFGAMAAYAFAWMPFRGRDSLFLVVVALLVVPLQMALIPAFQIFRNLGISGVPAMWLFHAAFGLPFAIFLLRNFMAGLPNDIMDAARIDGAGEILIFRSIVLPLSWPAIASLTIFQFTWTWNDLLVALVFSTEDKPLTVFLQNRIGTFSSGIDVISAGVFISAAVPLAVFFAFQKHFEAGLLGGSIK